MKHCYLPLFLLALLGTTHAQVEVFFDDFESGMDNWVVDGYWGISDEYAYEGAFSLTDSPYDPTYIAGEVQTVTMASGIDLSAALDADVTFYALIDLEEGFDYMYLDASPNGGTDWINIAIFNGEDMLDEWMFFDFALGAVVGSDDVKLRFRFAPDFFVEFDGMYIDNFTITSFETDASPPLIVHDPLLLYEGTLAENVLSATLLDASGISSTELWYSADGGSYASVSGTAVGGDEYEYIVPALSPGTWVDYYFTASDDYDIPNTTGSDTFSYLAGNYIGYDNGVIDFVQDIGDASASGYEYAAVRITLDSFTTVVSAVIQNYTDFTRPNDSIEIHIWADDAGVPGDDIITPFKVFPEATLDAPNKGTRIDLRPYADELEGLISDIYVGYGTPDGTAWLSQTTPGIAGRTLVYFGADWFELSDDYHFRVVTGPSSGAPTANFTFDASGDPVVAFTDLTEGFPDAWSWTFGDGATSLTQNPIHTYFANGIYTVCLNAENVLGSSTTCQDVTIGSYAPPAADFSFDDSADPLIAFTDLSTNDPETWSWTFGDGGSSSIENPTHTYATNGTFEVCLIAGNLAGTDEVCKTVTVDGNLVAPEADFAYSSVGLSVNFTDLSTNTPTFWGWTFGDGSNSLEQNPSHTYAAAGSFEVCMTAGNIAGTDEICKQVMLATSLQELAEAGVSIYPNPAVNYLFIATENWESGALIQLLDIKGVVVLEEILVHNQVQMDISHLPSGLYQLLLSGNDKVAMGGVAIEN